MIRAAVIGFALGMAVMGGITYYNLTSPLPDAPKPDRQLICQHYRSTGGYGQDACLQRVRG